MKKLILLLLLLMVSTNVFSYGPTYCDLNDCSDGDGSSLSYFLFGIIFWVVFFVFNRKSDVTNDNKYTSPEENNIRFLNDWTLVGKDTEDNSVVYVHIPSIQKKRNKVKMWRLRDYKTVQQDWLGTNLRDYLSLIVLNEYDCKKGTIKLISLSLYPQNMGKGNVVYSENNKKYEHVEIDPNSTNETLFKIACGEK